MTAPVGFQVPKKKPLVFPGSIAVGSTQTTPFDITQLPGFSATGTAGPAPSFGFSAFGADTETDTGEPPPPELPGTATPGGIAVKPPPAPVPPPPGFTVPEHIVGGGGGGDPIPSAQNPPLLPGNTPSQPGAGGGPTTFGPGDNLISTQIGPETSPELAKFNALLQQLAEGVGNFNLPAFNSVAPGQQPGSIAAGQAPETIGAGTFATAADTAAARQAITDRLRELSGSPDRGQLASDVFNIIEERGRPQFQKDLRQVGEQAAALGRIGAGMTTNELTDVLTQRQRDLDLTRRGLSAEAAGQTLNDRLNIFGATGQAAGQLFGQDAATSNIQRGLRDEARGERDFGFNAARSLRDEARGERDFGFNAERSLRNEARDERDTAFNQGLSRFGVKSSALGQIGGLQGQLFNQGVTNRDELRGERGFQTGEDQRNTDNTLRQRLAEEDLQNSEFNRNHQMRQLLAQVGFGGSQIDPGVAAQLAALLGGSGANATGASADLFAQLAQFLGKRNFNPRDDEGEFETGTDA